MERRLFPLHNVVPFTGRGRADDHSNYGNRPAAAVQCSGGLSHRRPPQYFDYEIGAGFDVTA
jgi:hypothetical protein